MPAETELKLAVSPRTLERLAGAVAGRAQHEAAQGRLHSVYYDTAGTDLWRQGIALRVRREADGWVQCVKGGGSLEAGVHRRIESETRLADADPQVDRIEDPKLRAAVSETLRAAPLQAVFTTEFARRTWTVRPAADAAIELCFDRGFVAAGARRQAVCEIELELKEGPVWRLFELALELEREAPLRVERLSKAERGYALALAVRAGPVKSKPPTLGPAMTSLEAFRALCFACLEHLDANRAGMLEGADSEYLHQMRVALRRLRSAISAFAPLLPRPAREPPVAEIRWLGRALGPARDWDVFGETTLRPVAAQLPGHPGLAALQSAGERLGALAQRRARRAVRSRRYQRMLLGLGAWLSGAAWATLLPLDAARELHRPCLPYAVAALERRWRRVRARGRGIAHHDAEALHRLRIAVKRLRYTAMFFAPLFPARRTARMLRAVEALQDALGGVNDCATADRLIAEARGKLRSAQARQAGELLAKRVAAARREHLRALRSGWKALREAKRFWTHAPAAQAAT